MDKDRYLLQDSDQDWWGLLSQNRMLQAIGIRDYMLTEGRMNSDADVTLTRMCQLFLEAGVPMERCATIVRILHSVNAASMRVWEHNKGAQSVSIPYRSRSDGQYLSSPSALAHQSRSWVRFNPQKVEDDVFGIIPELKEAGITDYICAPTFMVNGLQNVFTFATKAPKGFSQENLAMLKTTFPAIEACQEILVTHRILREVTRLYVGEEPHRRILDGDVHRGEVTRMKSAIMFVDMRDFTSLTSNMDAEDATAFLNMYYDCVVPAIEDNQGEVLKFIGDGILAMFRADDLGENLEEQACVKALAAAHTALNSVKQHNTTANQQFDIGIALHFGEVAYGNVGSGERLDYTVIGRDVNLTSRIADLCKKLDRSLLVSSGFEERLSGVKAEDCGKHPIKGFEKSETIYSV